VSQAGRKSQLLVEDQAMSKAISGSSGPRPGKKFKNHSAPCPQELYGVSV